MIEAAERLMPPTVDCEEPRVRKLSARIVPRSALTGAERSEMFRVFDRHYLCAREHQFYADLSEKQQVMLLHSADGKLAGFSTLDEWIGDYLGEPRRIFFSGDTIIAPQYWGTPEMPRLWTRYMFSRAAEDLRRRSFWFLISSGYKTYRLLPLFFRNFYPHHAQTGASELQALLSALAKSKFNGQFMPERGIVKLLHPTPLRPGVADAPPGGKNNPDVQFFLKRNPGHHAGDELACLAELALDNLTPAGRRMLGKR